MYLRSVVEDDWGGGGAGGGEGGGKGRRGRERESDIGPTLN